jgi:signal transduction histidine kinase/ligand-binding sensor domain-containing protein/DNA-binding response OmpR family regulator
MMMPLRCADNDFLRKICRRMAIVMGCFAAQGWLILSLPANLYAQNPSLQFDRLPSELGLSQNLISAIIQDRKGFLWFGTKDGLNKFDGYKFTVYRHNPFESTSLSDSYVTALLEDRAGRIWVGTLSGGLNLFEREREIFHRSLPDAGNPNSLSHERINALAEDQQGTIWIGTYGGGVNKLVLPAATRFVVAPSGAKRDEEGKALNHPHSVPDPQGSMPEGNTTNKTLAGAVYTRIQHEPGNPKSLGDNVVLKLAVDQKNVLWVATLRAIYQVMPADHAVIRFGSALPNAAWKKWWEKDRDEPAYTMAGGPEGKIWIGCELGFMSWNAATNAHTFHEPMTELPWVASAELWEDRTGALWCGSTYGLWRFDLKASTHQQFRHDPNDPHSIAESGIRSIYEDAGGVLWFGSNGNGLYKHDPKAAPFSPARRGASGTGKISLWRGTSIRAICETTDGAVWLAPSRGGLLRLNRRTGEASDFSPDWQNFPVPNYIFSLLQDRQGALWFGSGRGLYRLESRAGGSAGQFRAVAHYQPESGGGTAANSVYKIIEDHAGGIWIATITQIARVDQHNGVLIKYRFSAEDPNVIEGHGFPSLYEDRRGIFWLCSWDGLRSFDPASGRFKHYRNLPHNASSLSHNVVRAVHEDPLAPDKILWVGTAGGGLNRFDRETETFMHFTEKNGLPDNVIYALLSDGAGNLWMSTNKGLAKFDPRTLTFKNFYVQDGLQDNEFNSGAYFKSASGELFFGGIGGFNAFYPENIQGNPHAPPVALTGFQIFNKPVAFAASGSPLKMSITETKELTLRHDQKVFSFEFAALDYTDPSKNQYAYMMENFDNDWRAAGTNRTATYTNLDPGEYIFRVKGSNNDGAWNEKGIALKITITPPWWQTWWAYTLYALFIASTLYVFRRYEMNRQRLKHQVEIERLQAEKDHLETTKLQELDRLKSRFFANISHEFRTPLTLIMGQIDGLLERFPDMPFKGNLEMAFRNAQQLLRLINQLLDLSKLEAGGMELRAVHGNVVPLLKNLTHAFESLALKKRITLRFQTTAEEIKLYHEPDKIEKIMHNLLSNAFKFTPEGGKISVQLSVASDQLSVASKQLRHKQLFTDHRSLNTGNWLLITVRDSGIGIPQEHLPHVFDRFYQVDSSTTHEHEGTGIGLALTKELVELHGGEISVTSEEGFGTTFVVRLPFSVSSDQFSVTSGQSAVISDQSPVISDQLPVNSDQSLATSNEQPTTNNQRPATSNEEVVLIVEDNADLRSYLREHLEERFQIAEAADGEAGLVRALELIPDLVITDIMMPKLDGYALSKKLRSDEKTSHIPIIMLTARAEEADKIAGLEIGVDDYLTKPFSPNELRVRVRNLIALRKKLRERFSQTTLIKPSEVTVASVDQKFLERLKEIVEANMEEEGFDVQKLSAKAGMSERQLERKLKALIDQTPNQFIRSMRLQRAKQLLEQNAGTVSEIAFRLGFNNLSHFSKNFREAFGVLPSEVKGEG